MYCGSIDPSGGDAAAAGGSLGANGHTQKWHTRSTIPAVYMKILC